MWINSIKLRVKTKDVTDAGTDSDVLADILRDGQVIASLRLDYPAEDDLERGAVRYYHYLNLSRRNDQTEELPAGIGRNPMPYPPTGIEFSDGLAGHLRIRLRIEDDDMWIKDEFDFSYREFREVPDSFDTYLWREDTAWTSLGHWGKDIALSTDSSEGFTILNLNL